MDQGGDEREPSRGGPADCNGATFRNGLEKGGGPMMPWKSWLVGLGVAGALVIVGGCGSSDVPDPGSDGAAAELPLEGGAAPGGAPAPRRPRKPGSPLRKGPQRPRRPNPRKHQHQLRPRLSLPPPAPPPIRTRPPPRCSRWRPPRSLAAAPLLPPMASPPRAVRIQEARKGLPVLAGWQRCNVGCSKAEEPAEDPVWE